MDQVLRKHLWVVTLLSLAAVAFFLASGTGALLSQLLAGVEAEMGATGPVAPRRPSSLSSKAGAAAFTPRTSSEICRNNVFNFAKRPCAETEAAEEDEGGEPEEVASGVPDLCGGEATLVATMASSDPEWSFALITAEGKTMPYRRGSDVPGLGKIERVGWRLVLVDASGGPSCLLDLYPVAAAEGGEKVASANAPAPPGARPPPPRRVPGQLSPDLQKAVDSGIEVVSASERNIDRGLVDQLIENSSELMSQARILPYERDGAVQGFKLYGIRRDSLLGKLGLRNGDIINSIGGMEMTSPDRALEAYSKLRSASNLSVTITRRGRRQSLDFNIR